MDRSNSHHTAEIKITTARRFVCMHITHFMPENIVSATRMSSGKEWKWVKLRRHKSKFFLSGSALCHFYVAAYWHWGTTAELLAHRRWTAAQSIAHSGGNERDFRKHFTGVNNYNAHLMPKVQQMGDSMTNLTPVEQPEYRLTSLHPHHTELIMLM